MQTKLKNKSCHVCHKKYKPFNSMQKACSAKCALVLHKRNQERELKKAKQAYKRETKARREAQKTRSEWIADVQRQFNRYIRARDKGLPCVSCGTPEHEVEKDQGWKVGGAWDCGHFMSRGSERGKALRFNEINAHRQCKACNGGSGKYTHKRETVAQQYERNLRLRIGDDLVDWLQGPPKKTAKLQIDELRYLKKYYSGLANQAEKHNREG